MHLPRMQAATTSSSSHMSSNSAVTSHNHHEGQEPQDHPSGDSPSNSGQMSNMPGVPINVLSMQGNNDPGQNAVLTSGNMPLMYSSGILYATPSSTQTTLSDGDSGAPSHHLVMQDGTVVTNQGIPVSLQHVPGALQVSTIRSFQNHPQGNMLTHEILRSVYFWHVFASYGDQFCVFCV